MNSFFPLSFKNRISLNYIVTGSFLIAIVFFCIYLIVQYAVNEHINEGIFEEVNKHLDDVTTDENDTYLIRVDQWRAREHNSIKVNPVFVEFYDNDKLLIDKSPNLNDSNLILYEDQLNNKFINTSLDSIPLRQIQTTILNKGKIVGYLIVAMSLEDFEIVTILKKTLLISYPIILIILFLMARFFAGKSIKPVKAIIETSSKITRDNLTSRIPLPNNKDELYTLVENINNLLNRIEKAVEREKQFTSDASHELRTPLAVIKGTMEVLIRKPRTQTEYESKINFCISEVNRLNYLVDQLLLLARFENQKRNLKVENVYLNGLILDVLSRFSNEIKKKNLLIKNLFQDNIYIVTDHYSLEIIFTNLISNAIKYSHEYGEIEIVLGATKNAINCSIRDNGIGINEKDFDKIYDSFYRVSTNTEHPEIKGTGIGLSIVKRLCELLAISIHIQSKKDMGTTFTLSFKEFKN